MMPKESTTLRFYTRSGNTLLYSVDVALDVTSPETPDHASVLDFPKLIKYDGAYWEQRLDRPSGSLASYYPIDCFVIE